ncbi:hypothetical protein VTL71DRAFT_2570 [Oculimacula yallundae]|uniref:Zn(2)-C6 fungal-type domain-containing protein n=1 Tax=Oculimacula yallundae TaxID=86028 RepID=A0ABR4CB92_9HELO
MEEVATSTSSVKVKRTRRSAPRTKTGCITCKIRRIKCDERKPFCARCESFGIKCDGYATQQVVKAKKATVRPLAPRSVSNPSSVSGESVPSLQSQWRQIAAAGHSPSLPMELATLRFEDDTEARYFNLFQEKTIIHVAPYFDSETWQRLVLQACHVPSIRHTVTAIAALHRTSMTLDNCRKISLDLGESVANMNVHHQVAIDQYAKAIRSMKQALATGEQDLRTTIITCLVIGCFEAFHGNIPLAFGQIRTGIELLNQWKNSYGGHYILSYASPNQYVIEDDLVTTFGRLELLTGYAFTEDENADVVRRKQLAKVLQEMPTVFNSLTHARVYLELLFRQMDHYLYVSATWPDMFHKHSEIEQRTAKRLAIEMMAKQSASCPGTETPRTEPQNDETESMVAYPPDTVDWIDPLTIRSQETQGPTPLEEQTATATNTSSTDTKKDESSKSRDLHLAELLQWYYSFDNTMNQRHMTESVSSMMLRMHFKFNFVCLKTDSDDVMLPDQYTADIIEAVDLCAKILSAFRNGESTNFTLDFGMNIPLYVFGFKCRNSSVRRDIVNLSLTQPRREGFWDSTLSGKIVRWIQELEEEFAGDDFVPEWCRIRPAEVGFHMKDNEGNKATEEEFGREAELVCHQRLSPNNTQTRERRLTLVW